MPRHRVWRLLLFLLSVVAVQDLALAKSLPDQGAFGKLDTQEDAAQ